MWLLSTRALAEMCSLRPLTCTHFCLKPPACVPGEVGPHPTGEACASQHDCGLHLTHAFPLLVPRVWHKQNFAQCSPTPRALSPQWSSRGTARRRVETDCHFGSTSDPIPIYLHSWAFMTFCIQREIYFSIRR